MSAAPYVPVNGEPWRLSMGLRRLRPDSWLEIDADREAELDRKSRLLQDAPDVVVATLPGSEPAAVELLGCVVDFLATQHPGLLDATDEVLSEHTTGAVHDVVGPHPIITAARLVQEDLCVLEHQGDAWRLTAACVCFPSRWSLAAKLGQTLGGIHEPVPGFETTLLGPTTTFFDRLSVDRPVWRANWTLLDTDEPHLPEATGRLARWSAADLGSSLWFRVERQTLRRLPASGAVVFTIHTYVRALADVADTTPGFATALRDTMRTVSPEVAAYKGWLGLLEPLDAWLSTQPSAP